MVLNRTLAKKKQVKALEPGEGRPVAQAVLARAGLDDVETKVVVAAARVRVRVRSQIVVVVGNVARTAPPGACGNQFPFLVFFVAGRFGNPNQLSGRYSA